MRCGRQSWDRWVRGLREVHRTSYNIRCRDIGKKIGRFSKKLYSIYSMEKAKFKKGTATDSNIRCLKDRITRDAISYLTGSLSSEID